MFYMNPNLRLVFPHPYFCLYQTSGFALALGNLVYGLSVCGHGKAEDLGNRLRPSWIKIVLSEGAPTMLCLAALHGLVALVGSDVDVMQVKPGTLKGGN